MVTSLGRFLRKLRIDHNEILKDMAEKLEVSVSFLSAVENGRKKMPPMWEDQICSIYHLDALQADEFSRAIAESAQKVEINLEGQSEDKRAFAVAFARRFDDIDEEQIGEFKRMLLGEDKE